MIEILPMGDREEEKRCLAAEAITLENPRILVMEEGGEQLGQIVVGVERDRLWIAKISQTNGAHLQGERLTPESYFVMDSLLRSAASYGETNGATEMQTMFPDFADFFKQHGFQCREGHMYGKMNLLIHYSK